MPPETARQPVNPELVISMVCKGLGITTIDLRSKLRRAPLPMARAVIAHTLHQRAGYSYPEIGLLIDCSHSSVHQAENRLWMGQYDSELRNHLPNFTDATQYSRTVFDLCEEASQTPASSSTTEHAA